MIDGYSFEDIDSDYGSDEVTDRFKRLEHKENKDKEADLSLNLKYKDSLNKKKTLLENALDHCSNNSKNYYLLSNEISNRTSKENLVKNESPFRFNQTYDNALQVNENLYYDPQMDDEDEKWVKKTMTKGKIVFSDAILSCPCCLISVCLESQRDQLHFNKFRAFSVTNCKVNNLREKVVQEQVFHSIECEECDTDLGFYDPKGIYYFLNAIPTSA